MTNEERLTEPATEAPRALDPRDDDELARTREAQQAHGGSMAPGLVDETGHPVAEDGSAGPATQP